MKLLKAVGKVLSLPFDLVLIIGKLLLIPFVAISKLLHGEFNEWNKKRKFVLSSLKELFKAVKNEKDYTFSTNIAYTDESGKIHERIENIHLTKDSVQHYINYAKTSLKQESA
jgi:hypothetical protein